MPPPPRGPRPALRCLVTVNLTARFSHSLENISLFNISISDTDTSHKERKGSEHHQQHWSCWLLAGGEKGDIEIKFIYRFIVSRYYNQRYLNI